MLNRLTRTIRRDATNVTKEDMEEMRHLYYKEGVKTNDLCKKYRIGKERVIKCLNNQNITGGYTKRGSNYEFRGGDIGYSTEDKKDDNVITTNDKKDDNVITTKKNPPILEASSQITKITKVYSDSEGETSEEEEKPDPEQSLGGMTDIINECRHRQQQLKDSRSERLKFYKSMKPA